MFFDAAFCSWLTCFFSEAVSVPPLALRSAATCLLIFAALPDFVVAVVRRVGVVLVLIDLLGYLILLPVDLLLLRRRQLAAVGRAVRLGFAVDGRFFGFQVSGLTGRQLAALHALRDAVLLIFLALRHHRLGFGRGRCRRRGAPGLRLRGRLRARSRLILRHCHTAGQQHRSRQGAPLYPGQSHVFLLIFIFLAEFYDFRVTL